MPQRGRGEGGVGIGKRALDLVGASVVLTLASPLLVLGALAVLLGSGRPIFFGHRRLGRDGIAFRCWKLRTMRVGAEAELDLEGALNEQYRGNGFKIPTGEDPRVTRVGGWLRRSYVDEIPQLFNVLNGSMSLVGPRPVVEDELECYGGDAEELLRVRPGVFGEWTSRGRDRPPYPERAAMELEYLRHRSLMKDLTILARSIPVVFKGQEDR